VVLQAEMDDVVDHDQIELVVPVEERERVIAIILIQKSYHPASFHAAMVKGYYSLYARRKSTSRGVDFPGLAALYGVKAIDRTGGKRMETEFNPGRKRALCSAALSSLALVIGAAMIIVAILH
jgi:hypothetical protein